MLFLGRCLLTMTVPASAGSEGGGSSEMSKAGVFRSSVWLERRTGEQVGTVECGEYWSQGYNGLSFQGESLERHMEQEVIA